jgi:hypothetical protein
MKHILFSLIFVSVGSYSFSQDKSSAQPKASVYNDSVYWYGIDFSMLRLYDYTLIGKEEYVINTLCPSLTGYFKERVPDKQFTKWFGLWQNAQGVFVRKTLIDKSALSFNSPNQLSRDSLITIDGNRVISSLNVNAHVQNLNVNSTQGLGFIVLVESLGRKKDGINLIGIFFDINSRNVLHTETVQETLTKGSDVEAYGTGLFRGVRAILRRYSKKFKPS